MFLALFALAAALSTATSLVPDTTTPPRVERLSHNEQTQRQDALKALTVAEDALQRAKAELQGIEEGIEHDHGVNSDCGCYVGGSAVPVEDDVQFTEDGQYMVVRHQVKQADPVLNPFGGTPPTFSTLEYRGNTTTAGW